MPIRFKPLRLAAAALIIAGCGNHSMPTSPDARTSSAPVPLTIDTAERSNGVTGSWASSSSGGTVKEILTGPAIGGVVPEGEARADQSQFSTGGSTILTVQVKNVNLPDGTVLGVTLDFTPVGSLALSRGEGSMRADLGHFAVSRDQVRVKNGDAVILSGGFFQ